MNFNFPLIKKKFKYHEELKKQLLDLINKVSFPPEESNNKTYLKDGSNHSFYKHDWNDSLNLDRPWFQLAGYKITNQLIKMLKDQNYDDAVIYELWFQQYRLNNFHGWHLHGRHFSGVYYLQVPKDLKEKGTEFVDPFNPQKKFISNIKEGDIIIFPSNIWHRSPKITSNSIKTIISFNIEAVIRGVTN